MQGHPNWFYRGIEQRIAGYVGPDAAALWVTSRFRYLVAWVFGMPIAWSCALLAETGRFPTVLWSAAAASWIGCVAFGVLWLRAAGAASTSAAAYLSQIHGYRIEVSLPLTPWPSQWTRVVRRAEAEHESRVQLAQSAGLAAAVEQLVERRRASRRLWWLALALIGFLLGFIVGVLGAFAVGQTESLGVFVVFVFALCCAGVLPYSLHSKSERALDRYRADVTSELGQETRAAQA
jgi:hypothetical protein